MSDHDIPEAAPRRREPPPYLALIFGVVAATLEMAVILWLLYCR